MEIYLADNIKKLRREHSLTQEQLAEALGVTVGAVYKWESKQSMPEIKLLVEIAEFFETSVDVLLGYGWERGSMNDAICRISELCEEKNFDEAMKYAEKALQKYPNSFGVVYESGTMYALMMNKKASERALQLFERALKLIDQNTKEGISEWSIKNQIAICYADIGKYDKAVELLKKNNFCGVNNDLIGNIISQHCKKPEEALAYLSNALGNILSSVYRISLGYANAYAELGRFDDAKDMMLWAMQVCKGLHPSDTITYMDKGDVRSLLVLAEISALQENEEEAHRYLREAKALAQRFDSAPNYTMSGTKFHHGKESTVFDDFGDTAMAGIEKFIACDEAASHLQPIWELLEQEDIQAHSDALCVRLSAPTRFHAPA